MCCAKGLLRCGLCPKIFALDVPAEPPSNGTRGLFRESNFPRFWSARVGSMAAYQMQTVAVAWQIYHLTGSAFDLGLVGLVGFLPRLLLTLPAGHLADHADRRLIVAACQLLEALAVALLVVATLGGWVGRELIFAVVFLSGCARTFEMPTSQALLPGLVAPGVLPTAGPCPRPQSRGRPSSGRPSAASCTRSGRNWCSGWRRCSARSGRCCGFGTLAGVVLWMRWFPDLVSRERLEAAEQPA